MSWQRWKKAWYTFMLEYFCKSMGRQLKFFWKPQYWLFFSSWPICVYLYPSHHRLGVAHVLGSVFTAVLQALTTLFASEQLPKCTVHDRPKPKLLIPPAPKKTPNRIFYRKHDHAATKEYSDICRVLKQSWLISLAFLTL